MNRPTVMKVEYSTPPPVSPVELRTFTAWSGAQRYERAGERAYRQDCRSHMADNVINEARNEG